MGDLVSILTPVYDAKNSLYDAVMSVLEQTHENWEMHIVSDDGVDYQKLLASRDICDSRLYFSQTPRVQSGPNVGRNIGLAQAKGDWIAPLDADDVYYPSRLERLLVAAEHAGLSLDNVKITGQDIESRVVIEDSSVKDLRFSHFKDCLVPLLFLFNRRHITCGWDEDIARGADTIFNLRALESAGAASFLSEPLHEYRVHGKSMCHAEGAEELFDSAYHHTLERLTSDGLGFKTDQYRDQVTHLISDKRRINRAFTKAVKDGFSGNYQSFVEEHVLC